MRVNKQVRTKALKTDTTFQYWINVSLLAAASALIIFSIVP